MFSSTKLRTRPDIKQQLYGPGRVSHNQETEAHYRFFRLVNSSVYIYLQTCACITARGASAAVMHCILYLSFEYPANDEITPYNIDVNRCLKLPVLHVV